jgi:hypothetical protein
MLAMLKRRDPVLDEARGAAPDYDVPAFNVQAAHRIRVALAAPQEYGW